MVKQLEIGSSGDNFDGLFDLNAKQSIPEIMSHPSLNIFESATTPELQKYIDDGSRARSRIKNSQKYPEIPQNKKSEGSDSEEAVDSHIYTIKSNYDAKYPDELSVKVGDRVQISVTETRNYGNYLLAKSLETKEEGYVQSNCVDISSCETFPNNRMISSPSLELKSLKVSSTHCKNVFVWLLISVLAPFVVIAIEYSFKYMNDSPEYINVSPSTITASKFLHQKITKLSVEYEQISVDIQSTLAYCLENTLKGNQPCIILILNGGEEDFSDLLIAIGDLSIDLLKRYSDDSEVNKNIIKGSIISKSKEKYTYNHCKRMLEKGKVLLVDEVEMIPVEVMEAFQSLCDVYDPAVAKGVIVFLLNHKHISVDLDQNDATIANDILTELWKDTMHRDLINPLAIRVSENVINLNKK